MAKMNWSKSNAAASAKADFGFFASAQPLKKACCDGPWFPGKSAGKKCEKCAKA